MQFRFRWGAANKIEAGASPCARLHAGEGAHTGAAPRVELEVCGVCVQADTFAGSGPHVRRLAVSVHHAELRDCQVPDERHCLGARY